MALPGRDEATGPPAPMSVHRGEIRLVEASEARERTCVECGKRTSAWKPVRRKGTSLILCLECAAKPPEEAEESSCPRCGAALGPQDAFCGKCGVKIEYACPRCGAAVEADDVFCGKCGTRVG